MSERRPQGRPIRGVDEVGRNRIIEGTRAFLRSPTAGDITRKNIAHFIGVTPALISYYFPDSADLIEATTKPVVQGYADKLIATIASDGAPLDKLRQLVFLFTECNLLDGRTIDCFVDLPNNEYEFINFVLRETKEFIEANFYLNFKDLYDAKLAADALWAVCKFTAREEPIYFDKLTSMEDVISQRANRVYMFTLGGIRLKNDIHKL